MQPLSLQECFQKLSTRCVRNMAFLEEIHVRLHELDRVNRANRIDQAVPTAGTGLQPRRHGHQIMSSTYTHIGQLSLLLSPVCWDHWTLYGCKGN